MAEFKTFMSMNTGKIGRYPARFASRPSFIEVDPNEAPCYDCLPDDIFLTNPEIAAEQEQAVSESTDAANDVQFLDALYEDENTETEEN